jgi:RNA polymerase sigma-70 factor, ECF subfamily
LDRSVRDLVGAVIPAARVRADEQGCYGSAVSSAPPLPHAALDHVDALFRLARHLTGSDADADDLVQETYARALGATTQFIAGTNLRGWLFRILRNVYIDAYRRSQANPVLLGEDDDSPDAPGPPDEPLRGDEELHRLRGVVAEDIATALASLSVDARTVILLDLEGLTETELALALGCAVGTIKSRLCRARASLRKRLRDYSR